MKNLVLFLSGTFIATLAFGQGTSGDKLKEAKVFELKSGKVEYKLDGTTKGIKTLYWDDYGRIQHEYRKTTTKMLGISNTEETLTIRTKEWMYSIDLKEKTGTKTKTDATFQTAEAFTGTQGMTHQEREQYGEAMLKSMGGKEVGSETILGKPCKVIEISQMKSKVWAYKNVTLKLTVNMGGMLGTSSEEATSIEENIAVPASKFQPPAGIEIQDVTDMMKNIPGMPGMDDEEEE